MWKIEEKVLHAFSDDVNDFITDFLNIYANLVILTLWMLFR